MNKKACLVILSRWYGGRNLWLKKKIRVRDNFFCKNFEIVNFLCMWESHNAQMKPLVVEYSDKEIKNVSIKPRSHGIRTRQTKNKN
jgi:hypothetical protein